MIITNSINQVNKTLRLEFKTKKMAGEYVALHMTATKKMITGFSDVQIKEAIINVGEVNFQVKYNGAPGKILFDTNVSCTRCDTGSMEIM